MPWMVPSSPQGPCSSGNTTSTSPSKRGGWSGSETEIAREAGSLLTTTPAAVASTARLVAGGQPQVFGVAGLEHPAALAW